VFVRHDRNPFPKPGDDMGLRGRQRNAMAQDFVLRRNNPPPIILMG
jgi:hypothetical protein